MKRIPNHNYQPSSPHNFKDQPSAGYYPLQNWINKRMLFQAWWIPSSHLAASKSIHLIAIIQFRTG